MDRQQETETDMIRQHRPVRMGLVRESMLAFFVAFAAIAATSVPVGAQVSVGVGVGVGFSAGVEVLARGPVHEAFAQPVVFEANAGFVVQTAPPAIVEEVPPLERPAGLHCQWVPGYWSWVRIAGVLLVSGVWRVPPPEHVWVAGYWSPGARGWIWVPGFWRSAAVAEVEYCRRRQPRSKRVRRPRRPSTDMVPGKLVLAGWRLRLATRLLCGGAT